MKLLIILNFIFCFVLSRSIYGQISIYDKTPAEQPVPPSLHNSSILDAIIQGENAKRQREEREQQRNREKVKARIEQVKSYYFTFYKYPGTINDGYHTVMVTDNYDFCEERRVIVRNNKIVQYIGGKGYVSSISSANSIYAGKSMINLKNPMGESIGYFDVYFFDDIINHNTYTTPLK